MGGADRRRAFVAAAGAMALVVVVSNVLVRFPVNDWLTWGAFSYPFAFLVTDVVNRLAGPAAARRIVYVGFALGVALSIPFGARIAFASGSAFLLAQLADVALFDRLRARARWWLAPALSSAAASVLDTALFFSLAFAGSGLPWMGWAVGDLAVKWAVAALALLPYRALVARLGASDAFAHARRAP